MRSVSVAEAKAKLSELIHEAEAGEPVNITRRGEVVVQLVAARKKKRKIDVAALRLFAETITPQKQSAGEFMRELRDTERY